MELSNSSDNETFFTVNSTDLEAVSFTNPPRVPLTLTVCRYVVDLSTCQ